jgi:Flp pilus assembly protein TadB
MIVQAKFAALKGIKPHEFALRFLFGGLVCVAAGLIAKEYGPAIGGLFLAFPAIFPRAQAWWKRMRRHTRLARGLTEPIAGA